MRLASPPSTPSRPPTPQRLSAPAPVRPVAAIRSGMPGARPESGGALAAPQDDLLPQVDYRPLLIDALRASGSYSESAEPATARTEPGDQGAVDALPDPASGAPAPWRWNVRYGADTLASLYARMSGELITLGSRVDDFA
jgi:hypothetical protein